MANPPEYNATLIQRTQVSPRMAIFRVRPDEREVDFTAGQFIVLGMKYKEGRLPEADPEEPIPEEKHERLIRRAYSISSSSENRDYLEFYISLVTSGQLTPRLFNLEEGGRLFLGL